MPPEITDYDLEHLTDDMAHLLDALEIDRAVFVGHDWGVRRLGLPVRYPERCLAATTKEIEAEIGKSRLVHRLRERLRGVPHSWLEGRGSPCRQKSAFYPVIELVEHALGFREEDAVEQKIGRLERALRRGGLDVAEAMLLFASLLSLPLPEGCAPLAISPQLHRQKTLGTLLAWLPRSSLRCCWWRTCTVWTRRRSSGWGC